MGLSFHLLHLPLPGETSIRKLEHGLRIIWVECVKLITYKPKHVFTVDSAVPTDASPLLKKTAEVLKSAATSSSHNQPVTKSTDGMFINMVTLLTVADQTTPEATSTHTTLALENPELLTLRVQLNPRIKFLTEKSDSWVILNASPENVKSIKRTELSVFKDSEASSVDQLLSTKPEVDDLVQSGGRIVCATITL